MSRKQYVPPFVSFSQSPVQEMVVVEVLIPLQVLLEIGKKSKMTMRIEYR
jgi:hypothetical protein